MVFSRETAVAVATPALVHTLSSAPPEPSASPPGTASPAPGPRSAWGLHTREATHFTIQHPSLDYMLPEQRWAKQLQQRSKRKTNLTATTTADNKVIKGTLWNFSFCVGPCGQKRLVTCSLHFTPRWETISPGGERAAAPETDLQLAVEATVNQPEQTSTVSSDVAEKSDPVTSIKNNY